MLEQIEEMFTDMTPMLKKLKKDTYQERMADFTEKYGHYFEEMIEYMESAENLEEAKTEVCMILATRAERKFIKKDKIPGSVRGDMDFFMIYYVFPAILKMNHARKVELADRLCEVWNAHFDCNISYAEYETICGGFREKLFGFIPR